MPLVPGIIGWAIGMASGPTALMASAYIELPMPMPHCATWPTASWPKLKPLLIGSISMMAKNRRTGAQELVVWLSTRPFSAARVIWMMVV